MDKALKKTNFKGHHCLNISGSKSESNRLLILKDLYPNINIGNISTSDDTTVLKTALKEKASLVDVHHAGTAMRFLTAYFSCFTKSTLVLTGSDRMQNRPISLLVKALRELGANIEYLEKDGYPPLRILPAKIKTNKVSLQANVSSQYISALMLVAPKLNDGLEINLDSKITSLPYLKMTEKLMLDLGFSVSFEGTSIKIKAQSAINAQNFDVESDWSSASYFYSLVALNPDLSLELKTYKKESLQGDAALSELYESLGVKTTYTKDSIVLKNINKLDKSIYEKNLNDNPDLAQTIAVTCFGLGKACKLDGLHTLKIKETDRLAALKVELEKFGAQVHIDKHSLHMKPAVKIKVNQKVKTYNDHRMAMAFAPLCSVTSLMILEADVVTKSYPDFWKDLGNLLK